MHVVCCLSNWREDFEKMRLAELLLLPIAFRNRFTVKAESLRSFPLRRRFHGPSLSILSSPNPTACFRNSLAWARKCVKSLCFSGMPPKALFLGDSQEHPIAYQRLAAIAGGQEVDIRKT